MSKNSFNWELVQFLVLVLFIVIMLYMLTQPWTWLYQARFEGLMLLMVPIPFIITVLKSKNYHQTVRRLLPILAIGSTILGLAHKLPGELVIVTHFLCFFLLIAMYGLSLQLISNAYEWQDFKNWVHEKHGDDSSKESIEALNIGRKWL